MPPEWTSAKIWTSKRGCIFDDALFIQVWNTIIKTVMLQTWDISIIWQIYLKLLLPPARWQSYFRHPSRPLYGMANLGTRIQSLELWRQGLTARKRSEEGKPGSKQPPGRGETDQTGDQTGPTIDRWFNIVLTTWELPMDTNGNIW